MKVVTAQVSNERELQDAIVELARTFAWKVAHFRPAQTAKGWRTPGQYDARGFPDLVLVRDRVVFAELKSARGIPSTEQCEWEAALKLAGAEYHLWTPDNWIAGDVDRVLVPGLRAA